MAKIGNETKLILKLAGEKADQLIKESVLTQGLSESSRVWHRAYRSGINAYRDILNNISKELEEGR